MLREPGFGEKVGEICFWQGYGAACFRKKMVDPLLRKMFDFQK